MRVGAGPDRRSKYTKEYSHLSTHIPLSKSAIGLGLAPATFRQEKNREEARDRSRGTKREKREVSGKRGGKYKRADGERGRGS